MPRHTVDVDGGQLGLDQGAGVTLKIGVDVHAVGGDPLVGDLLLKVGDLGHVDHLGLDAVGLVAQALDGGHLGGLAAHGGLHRCAADLVGLGHIGAAGQMAGTALQRRKLDSAGLAAQADADQVRQIAARTAQDGLVTEGIQLACRGDQIAQENAVLVLDALADRDNNIVALFFQLGHALEERLLVKGALGQQDQVWAVAVRTGSQTGGSSQPAGVLVSAAFAKFLQISLQHLRYQKKSYR